MAPTLIPGKFVLPVLLLAVSLNKSQAGLTFDTRFRGHPRFDHHLQEPNANGNFLTNLERTVLDVNSESEDTTDSSSSQEAFAPQGGIVGFRRLTSGEDPKDASIYLTNLEKLWAFDSEPVQDEKVKASQTSSDHQYLTNLERYQSLQSEDVEYQFEKEQERKSDNTKGLSDQSRTEARANFLANLERTRFANFEADSELDEKSTSDFVAHSGVVGLRRLTSDDKDKDRSNYFTNLEKYRFPDPPIGLEGNETIEELEGRQKYLTNLERFRFPQRKLANSPSDETSEEDTLRPESELRSQKGFPLPESTKVSSDPWNNHEETEREWLQAKMDSFTGWFSQFIDDKRQKGIQKLKDWMTPTSDSSSDEEVARELRKGPFRVDIASQYFPEEN